MVGKIGRKKIKGREICFYNSYHFILEIRRKKKLETVQQFKLQLFLWVGRIGATFNVFVFA